MNIIINICGKDAHYLERSDIMTSSSVLFSA